jgi:hypothetical protein
VRPKRQALKAREGVPAPDAHDGSATLAAFGSARDTLAGQGCCRYSSKSMSSAPFPRLGSK